MARLGDIAEYLNGKAFKPSEWSNEGLPIIRIQNLNNPNAAFNYCNFEVDEKFVVNTGDLLFAWSGTPGTSFGAHIWKGGTAVLNQHIFKIKFDETFLDKSFYNYSLNFVLEGFIKQAHGGAGLAHITKKKFEESHIPLAPLAEQKRIVAKLDEAFQHLETIKAKLARIPDLLKNFREAVLTQAVTGKLTEEWRGEKSNIINLFASFPKKEMREVNILLPNNWLWLPFSSVAKVESKLVEPLDFFNLPLIAPDNIESETGRLINIPLVSEIQPKSAKHIFKKGSIVYSKIRPYLSKLILANFDGLCSADMYPVTTNLETKYLYYYMLSRTFLSYANTAGERSVLPKINQQGLSKIPVSVPPKEEQREIVRRLENLFAKADAMEASYLTLKVRIEKLPQSLLIKAFRGELVPQNEQDEPASVLLERIKAAEVGKVKGWEKRDMSGKKGEVVEAHSNGYLT